MSGPSPSASPSSPPIRSLNEESKEVLLSFVSSEITSHAGSILGLAVLLFAYLTAIFDSNYFPKISVNLANIPFRPTFDYAVIFVIFWVLISGIMYSVMRLIYYGNFANETIHFSEKKGRSLEMKELWDEVAANVHKIRGFSIVPMSWFSRGISKDKGGIWFSFGIGFIMSVILFVVFFIK